MLTIPTSARSQLDIVHDMLKEVKNNDKRVSLLLNYGRLARIVGETVDAQHALTRALELAEQLENHIVVAQTLIELAYCDRLLGSYSQAFDRLRQARRLIRLSQAMPHEIHFWIAYLTGVALGDRARHRRSATCLLYAERQAATLGRDDLRALALARLIDADVLDDDQRDIFREEAVVLGEGHGQMDALALALSRWPRQTGIVELRRAYNLACEIESAELIIEAGNKLAFGLRDNHQALEGVQLVQECVQRASELGYLRLTALCQHNLGVLYRGQGHYSAAREPLVQAVALQRRIGSRRLTISLTELGLTYLNTGEYDLGLRCVKEAYQIHKLRDNLKGMQTQARNIGIFYHRLNDWATAEEWYECSRAFAVQRNGEKGRSYLTGNQSSLYQAWAKYSHGEERARLLDKALEYANQAIERTEEFIFPKEASKKPKRTRKVLVSYVVNLGRKGSILLALDRPKDAISYLYCAYRLAKQKQFVRRVPRRLLSLAQAYSRLGRLRRATLLATAAVARARELDSGFSVELVAAYQGRGSILRKAGNFADALADYEQAIAVVQRAFALLQSESAAIQTLVDQEMLFANAVELAWRLNQPVRAFDLQEQGRAPAFRKIIASTNLQPPPSIPQHLVYKERILLEQQAGLGEDIVSAEEEDEIPEKIEDIHQRLTSVQQSLNAVWDQMQAFPQAQEYLMIRQAQPRTFKDICQVLLA